MFYILQKEIRTMLYPCCLAAAAAAIKLLFFSSETILTPRFPRKDRVYIADVKRQRDFFPEYQVFTFLFLLNPILRGTSSGKSQIVTEKKAHIPYLINRVNK